MYRLVVGGAVVLAALSLFILAYVQWEGYQGRCTWERAVERALERPAPKFTKYYKSGHMAGEEK